MIMIENKMGWMNKKQEQYQFSVNIKDYFYLDENICFDIIYIILG